MMIRKKIEYKNLELFFIEIQNNENSTYTHVELEIDSTSDAEQYAKDIEKILDYFIINDFSKLEIQFSNYRRSDAPIISTITNRLTQGNYPKGLIIHFTDTNNYSFDGTDPEYDKTCIIPLIKALESGNCYYPLTIQLKRTSDDVVNTLAQALMSGKCHRGLCFDFQYEISLEAMLKIMRALRHKNCPEDLSLGIHYGYGAGSTIFFVDAMQQREIPKGLTLKLYGSGSDHAYYLGSAFTSKNFSKNLPSNLKFEFFNVGDFGSEPLKRGLEKSFKQNTLPFGLDIHFTLQNHAQLSIKNDIDEILKKNTARHTALSCMVLWQGYRQDNGNVFSTLPEEIIKHIQSYTFFSSTLPFFKNNNNHHEQLIKEEKIFAKNIATVFKK